MKPAAKAAKPQQRKPDVIVGDEVFYQHRGAPRSGHVRAHGEHGCTIGDDGHRVLWEHVLGHKKRAAQQYHVDEEGEDGMIVKDQRGLRQYLAVPPEARQQDEGQQLMLTKSGGSHRMLMIKGLAPRAGLTEKKITDKNGVQTSRWVNATPEMPKAVAGKHVGWQNGDVRSHGEVRAAGKDGVTARDQAGGLHQVRHEHVTHHWQGEGAPTESPHRDAPARPNYEPRQSGEDDKAYAKRVVDRGDEVKHLPEDHGRYFNDADKHQHVTLDKLHSTKSDEENKQGGDNGPKRMLAAYHGALGKRAPIKVMPHADKPGHYEVVDGNGTLTSAQKMGWGSLPVQAVGRDEGEAAIAEDKAKELTADYKDLPARVSQPHKSWEALMQHAPAALDELKTSLGTIAKAMGLRTDKGPKDMTPDDWASGDGHLLIDGLKGEARAREKVESDYGGDWSKLNDVVRATITVNTLDEVKQAIEHMKAAGLEFAQQPKNRFAKPTEMGYRDLMTVVRLPGGMNAELQFSTKAMSQAKKAGHAPYEVYRTLQAKHNSFDEPDDSWPEEDAKAFYDAVKEQRQIYGDAWKKSAGNASGAAKKPAAKPGAEGGEVLQKSAMLLIMKPLKGGRNARAVPDRK